MIVIVHLFARARDLAGADRLEIELPAEATVGDLRRQLAEEAPALAALVARSAIAVNADFAGDEQRVSEGVEIALLPPVSGGSHLEDPLASLRNARESAE